jgi:hypothetical protein
VSETSWSFSGRDIGVRAFLTIVGADRGARACRPSSA